MWSAIVKGLSPTAFEALLSSEHLQVKTEGEAFWLLVSWVEAQSAETEEGKQALFERMVGHMRFHAMDPGYILLIVTQNRRVIAAGMGEKLLRESLIHSHLRRRTSAQGKDYLANRPKLALLESRAPSGIVSWALGCSFTVTEVCELAQGRRPYRFGLVGGMPWLIQLAYNKERSPKNIGAYMMPSSPVKTEMYKDGSGFFHGFSVEVGCGTFKYTMLGSSECADIWRAPLGRGYDFASLEELTADGSPWLKEGNLHIKVTICLNNEPVPQPE